MTHPYTHLPTAESVKSFCLSMGIGPTTFYKHVKLGNITTIKVGKKTLVPTSERQAFLDRLSGKAA
jgi:hypothetical protein